METQFYLAVSLFAALTFLSPPSYCTTTQSPAAEKTLKLRSDLWCPFVCDPGDKPGVIVEIVQRVLGPKYKIDFQLLNWARAVSDTREGVYDGIIGAAVSDAPDFVFPREEQAVANFEFFTLKSDPWKYAGDLSGRKIGVINAYSYDDLMTRKIEKKDPKFVIVSGDHVQRQLVSMLLEGRVNAIYETPSVFRSTVKAMGLDERRFQSAGGPPQPNQKIFVGFSPKLKDAFLLAGEIEAGMKKMRKTKELRKILDRYEMKDWK